MPLPVFGQCRIDVQEDLRAVPPEVAEQGVFRAGEHTEARQQDGAPSEKVGQRREVVSVRSFFQRAGDDKRVEAGRGEIGFDQRVAVTAENLAERAEKGRPERSHFAFRIQHVLGREPLREALLQQLREPHPPREKSERGKYLIKVDRYFASSKICSACGKKKEKLSLSERIYYCECGYRMDRDVNAAVNIMNEGKRIFAECA